MSLLAYFHSLDLRILYWINRHHTPFLDRLMAYVSDFDTWRVPVYGLSLYILLFGHFRLRLFMTMLIACLVIGDGGINTLLFKDHVNRPRPMEHEAHLRVVTVREITESQPHPVAHGNSFTSGHACNNLALALIGTAIFGRAAWFLWPWAVLVGYSRVYCTSHYPSDILGSWIIAFIYTYFILKAADWLWRTYAPERFPQLYAKYPVLFPGWFVP